MPDHRQKLDDNVLYATVNDKWLRITAQQIEDVPSLPCQHKEANGRLLLYAALASRDGYQAVVTCSEDTDVFIMLMAPKYKIEVPFI